MMQYRISDSALADIADILKHSQLQFGSSARIRYQELIKTAIEDLASMPTKIGSNIRDEVATGLRSYHLFFSRKRAATSNGTVQRPRHIIFYRLTENQEIEVVRILHDAMETRHHIPEE